MINDFKCGGAQLGKLGSQGAENLQLRWQVSQESAELHIIKLASAKLNLEGASALSTSSALSPLNWTDLTHVQILRYHHK